MLERREIKKTLYTSTLQHKLFCFEMLVRERNTGAETLEWEVDNLHRGVPWPS